MLSSEINGHLTVASHCLRLQAPSTHKLQTHPNYRRPPTTGASQLQEHPNYRDTPTTGTPQLQVHPNYRAPQLQAHIDTGMCPNHSEQPTLMQTFSQRTEGHNNITPSSEAADGVKTLQHLSINQDLQQIATEHHLLTSVAC